MFLTIFYLDRCGSPESYELVAKRFVEESCQLYPLYSNYIVSSEFGIKIANFNLSFEYLGKLKLEKCFECHVDRGIDKIIKS